jgi:nucleotide-binding universal stress UspA family protein
LSTEGAEKTTSKIGRILVGVDGSDPSKRAVSRAITVARATGAKLYIVYVVHIPVYASSTLLDSPAIDYSGVEQALTEVGKRVVAEAVKQAEGSGVEVAADVLERATSIVQSMLDYATDNKIDLIVVGSRGLSGLKRVVLGSVSGGLVNHAHCDVLVVR